MYIKYGFLALLKYGARQFTLCVLFILVYNAVHIYIFSVYKNVILPKSLCFNSYICVALV